MNRFKNAIVNFSLYFMLFIIFSCNAISVKADEIYDSIIDNWATYNDRYYCPDINASTDDILKYCQSIVNQKKGDLINDAYTIDLCFEYNGVNSLDEFSDRKSVV